MAILNIILMLRVPTFAEQGREVTMHIIQLIIVGAIVAGAAFFSARSLYRSFKGQKAACACGEDSCACAAKGNCDQEHPHC